MRHSANLWLATALLLLSAILLIPRLEDESLWGDEGWSLVFSDGSPRQVAEDLTIDRHPPFYFMTLYLWRGLAGNELEVVRLLAIFGSLLTAVFLYRLGQRLFGATAALAALFWYVLADDRLAYSIEVRHYTWLLAWATLATWQWVRWLQTGRGAFWYVLALIGGLYTHSFMFVVLLVQGLVSLSLLGLGRRFWRLASLWACSLIAFLPWSLVFAHQFIVRGGITHDMPMTWATGEFLLARYLGPPLAVTLGMALLGLLTPWVTTPYWGLQGRRPHCQAVYWALLALLLPLLLVLLSPHLSEDSRFLTERNLSIILPPLVLLMGLGLVALTGLARWGLVGAVLITALLTDYPNPHNPPWRPIARWLAQYQVAGQPVIADIDGDFGALEYHWEQESSQPQRVVATYELVWNSAQLDPLTALRFEGIGDATGFWYVFWDNDPFFVQAVEGWGFQRMLTLQESHLGSPIYLYRYDDPAALLPLQVARFGADLVLHQAYAPEAITAGQHLSVSLWWSLAQPIPDSYTVSLFLLNEAGQQVAVQDELPTPPLPAWEAGHLYYQLLTLPVAPDLSPGAYTLGLKVYNDGGVLSPAEASEFWILGTVTIER